MSHFRAVWERRFFYPPWFDGPEREAIKDELRELGVWIDRALGLDEVLGTCDAVTPSDGWPDLSGRHNPRPDWERELVVERRRRALEYDRDRERRRREWLKAMEQQNAYVLPALPVQLELPLAKPAPHQVKARELLEQLKREYGR